MKGRYLQDGQTGRKRWKETWREIHRQRWGRSWGWRGEAELDRWGGRTRGQVPGKAGLKLPGPVYTSVVNRESVFLALI